MCDGLKKRIPKWSTLRPVGKSFAVRLTVLIPLIGYFIIFNDAVVGKLKLIEEIAGIDPSNYGQSVPPRLFQVYFGLCALGFGAAIYSFLCPPQVSYYGTAAAYVGGDGSSIGDFAFEEIENTLKQSRVQQEFKRIRERYTPPETSEQKAEINKGVLNLYFTYLDTGQPCWRAAATFFYTLGFLSLGLSSIKVFWRVLVTLIHVASTHGLLSLF
jgi:hypothetical protein